MRKTLLILLLILPMLTACGKTGSAVVEVRSVRLDKTELNLAPGQTVQLTATVEPADASDLTLTWKTDDKHVATVHEGTVTAVAEGTTTVTVLIPAVSPPPAGSPSKIRTNRSPRLRDRDRKSRPPRRMAPSPRKGRSPGSGRS